jgi:gelsolin
MAKQAKLEESNCAKIGSVEDMELRRKAAEKEPAWTTAGKAPGLKIWRIEKFQVKDWPTNQYGSFYDGDSYICLSTYKVNEKLMYDIHFWLGLHSTQDERGTAAYKTVELDDYLGTLPVQHREVQGCESDKFLTYFKNEIKILHGGIESGFNIVKPKEYIPKLLHIKGKKRITVLEVDLSSKSLNIGDAFVLDCGLKIYQWLPSKSGATEKYRAAQVATELKNSRKGAEVEVLDEAGSEEFWKILGGKDQISCVSEVPTDEEFEKMGQTFKKCIWKLSDETGKIEFKKVQEGKIEKKTLDTNDAFIIDVGCEVIAWVGKKASPNEIKFAILFATTYLHENNRPVYIPISRVCESNEPKDFDKLFN